MCRGRWPVAALRRRTRRWRGGRRGRVGRRWPNQPARVVVAQAVGRAAGVERVKPGWQCATPGLLAAVSQRAAGKPTGSPACQTLAITNTHLRMPRPAERSGTKCSALGPCRRNCCKASLARKQATASSSVSPPWLSLSRTAKTISKQQKSAIRDTCRRHGVQIGTINALLVQLSRRHDLKLLSTDHDFRSASIHVEFNLWGLGEG